MAVILIFLLLGGLILCFFGELTFTATALALLTAVLIAPLDLSGTWLYRLSNGITAPEISAPAVIAWCGYMAVGVALLWKIIGPRRPRIPRKGATPITTAHPSTSPGLVDLARLEADLLGEDPTNLKVETQPEARKRFLAAGWPYAAATPKTLSTSS